MSATVTVALLLGIVGLVGARQERPVDFKSGMGSVHIDAKARLSV